MLATKLHTIDNDEDGRNRPSRLRAASSTASWFFRGLGRALATPSGDTRRPYYPQQREHM